MKLIRSFGKKPFWIILALCAQFAVLTFVAMMIYPGGSGFDSNSQGYSFWGNFFSELGFTVTRSGEANPIGAVLFFTALSLAGVGLILFFVFSIQFFWKARLIKLLYLVGSAFGILSGLGYIGIAFTPANLFPEPHLRFVLLAFRALLPAVICYMFAILLNSEYPNRYAAVYVGFVILLSAYIALLTVGPGLDTMEGVMIQATGQKIIVYAALLTIGIQSWGAVKILESEAGSDAAN